MGEFKGQFGVLFHIDWDQTAYLNWLQSCLWWLIQGLSKCKHLVGAAGLLQRQKGPNFKNSCLSLTCPARVIWNYHFGHLDNQEQFPMEVAIH